MSDNPWLLSILRIYVIMHHTCNSSILCNSIDMLSCTQLIRWMICHAGDSVEGSIVHNFIRTVHHVSFPLSSSMFSDNILPMDLELYVMRCGFT